MRQSNLTPTVAIEDYLESILILEKLNVDIRVINIANNLNIKSPSVIKMIKKMSELGYVNYKENIEFTEKGRKLAECVYDKHLFLKGFFKNILKVSEDISEKDACKIEHFISKETHRKLIKYLEFININKDIKDRWFEYIKDCED